MRRDPEEIALAVQQGVGAEDLEKAKRLAAALDATCTPYFVGPGGIICGEGPAVRFQALTTTPASSELNY